MKNALKGAVLGFLFAILAGTTIGVGHAVTRGVPNREWDPSATARFYAQAISETLNCSAALALLLVPATALFFARRRRAV
jgi:hypothetical protein